MSVMSSAETITESSSQGLALRLTVHAYHSHAAKTVAGFETYIMSVHTLREDSTTLFVRFVMTLQIFSHRLLVAMIGMST